VRLAFVLLAVSACVQVPLHPANSAVLTDSACAKTVRTHNGLVVAGVVVAPLAGVGTLAGYVPTVAEKISLATSGIALAIAGGVLEVFAGLEANQIVQGHCAQ
jgi:hypothetical protein